MFQPGDLEESREDMHLWSVFPAISTSSKMFVHHYAQFIATSS